VTTLEVRVAELLENFPPAMRTRLLRHEEAEEILAASGPTIDRRVAAGQLRAVKSEGADRRGGRGRAGSVRFWLVDLLHHAAAREIGGDRNGDLVGTKRAAADLREAAR
jgi:hypothetical protein